MFLYLLILSAALVRNSMTLELVLPDSAHLGDPVPMTLRVMNTGSKQVKLYTQGRPTAFDIVVSRPDGTPVWHRLNHALVTSVLQIRKLRPGEVLEFTDSWNQRDDRHQAVPAGEYRVTGILPTDPPGALRSSPTRLYIVP